MRYEGYMVIVRDARTSREFYETVIGAAVLLDLGNHVVFEGGWFLLQEDDWLSFSEQQAGALRYRANTGELVFATDDIDGFMARLRANPEIPLLHGLKEHPWGRRAVRFYDPDGHIVEVGESMELVVKRFLRNGLSVDETTARSEFPREFVLKCLRELERERSLPPGE